MPNVRKYRKGITGRKKRGGRYRKRYYRKKGMRSSVSPIPNSFSTKLRIVDNRTYNPGIVTAANALYNVNSVYDPYYTGTGHQPLGFDQLMGLYDECYVYKSKIICDFMTTDSTAGNAGVVVGINISPTTSPILTYETICEQPHTQYKALTVQGGSRTLCRITKWWSWRKWNSNRYIHERNLNTISAGPIDGQYFNVWTIPANSAVDPANVHVVTTITYYVKFLKPKQLGQS